MGSKMMGIILNTTRKKSFVSIPIYRDGVTIKTSQFNKIIQKIKTKVVNKYEKSINCSFSYQFTYIGVSKVK